MVLTQQELGALDFLESLIRGGKPLAHAADTLFTVLQDQDLVDRVVDARARIAKEKQHIAFKTALTDPEDRPEPWYTGPAALDIYWPGLKSKLEADPGWKEAVVSLDDSSTDIVGLLAAPNSRAISTRGLVLGYVQSGKTANFTATIAKAADAGYRLFIVLSGVHNALRRQTQLRLEDQLIALHPAKWLALTTESNDFGNPVRALPLVTSTDLRLLAVVKKNVTRLTNLRNWLREAHKHGGLDTCPVLIIDDESDQASPNTAKDAELDRTVINRRIVELLDLPRVAYVGYTATPFANVLMNPADARDMYPRSFIYSLPKPDGYFGSEELFGRSQSEQEEQENPDSTPHDMIRLVPDSEADIHSVGKKNTPVAAEITPSLDAAIRWFILATAARRARSDLTQHSSMLVHTTMRVDPQLAYVATIREHVKYLSDDWSGGHADHWEERWERETTKEPAARSNLEPVPFRELSEHMTSVLSDVKVLADNSRSNERLIYSDDPATVIAVGGNTLSRGLTLEGLVCSFFLRTASTYDSLLQMGRWFGYRPGYADLPRIWTTEQLASDFGFLAGIEYELRREIERYQSDDQASPINLPVRIQLHPRMHVTAKIKMQFAVPAQASYSGQRPQTTYFHHRSTGEIDANLNAARDLIRGAIRGEANVDPQPSRIILRDVPAEIVLKLVSSYKFHQDTELQPGLIEKYIERQIEHGALEIWNVAVITRQSTDPAVDLGLPQKVTALTRSKLQRGSDRHTANIGTLMSKPDRVADIMEASAATKMEDRELQKIRNDSSRGLVLIYPIDKDSKPKPSAKHRETLDASGNLTGLAFAFPSAALGSEPTATVQVDPSMLPLPSMDEPVEQLDEYVDDEGSQDEVSLGDE